MCVSVAQSRKTYPTDWAIKLVHTYKKTTHIYCRLRSHNHGIHTSPLNPPTGMFGTLLVLFKGQSYMSEVVRYVTQIISGGNIYCRNKVL